MLPYFQDQLNVLIYLLYLNAEAIYVLQKKFLKRDQFKILRHQTTTIKAVVDICVINEIRIGINTTTK